MELEEGQTVEKYEVETELGRGGMAVVYKVRHRTLDAPAALKLLTITSREIRERLLREGKIQARLSHPNVVGVTDVITIEEQPGLVMEFVDGPDLDEWIKAEQPDPALAEEIFRQIVAGVAEAHGQDIVHRDLKPANVLMARSESGWIPKVADFGLTKILVGDDGVAKTRSGLPMGTPSYMPPEQIASAKDVDHRADIWALGCILYELCLHHRPFDGQDLGEVFDAVRSADPAASTHALPTHISRTIDACLQPDAADRPKTCADVLALLDEPRRDEPVNIASSEPELVYDRLTEPPSRLPILATFGVGGVVLAGGGGFAVLLLLLIICFGGWGDPCSTWLPGTVGYARAGGFFLKSEGQTWTPRRDVTLYDDHPREGNDWSTDHAEVCTLPAGTSIQIDQEPIRAGRGGVWVPISSGSYELPEEE